MITFIALLALLVWLYLLLFHGGFWRADQRLPQTEPPVAWPEVCAIIPARDEAEHIAATVAAHMASTYPGEFSVILADDHSTDNTAALARTAAENAPRALHVAPAPVLEQGWTGKLWAQESGRIAARKTAPAAKYLLLCDADIRFGPDVLARLVAKAETEDLALVSLMARLDARGLWGDLLIPAFVYFFQKLYPFRRVNNPSDLMAGAAGGCMLVRRDALERIGGFCALKGALIDDCTLARLIKGAPPKRKIWLGFAADVTSARDNRSLASIWKMVARTAYTQLRYNPLLLLGAVAGMLFLYLSPPVITLTIAWHKDIAAFFLALMAWAVMIKTYSPTRRLYGQPAIAGMFLPLAALLYTLMTVTSAFNHWRGKGGQWKGRTYPSP